MLVQKLEVSETYAAVTRPAIMDAIHEVLDFYGIRQNLAVYFNGEPGVARMFGGNLNDKLRKNEETDYINRSRILVTHEMTSDEFNTGFGNLGTNETNSPLWEDPLSKMRITPEFSGRKIKVEATAHITGRQQAINLRNRFQMKLDRQSARPTFDAHIHYPVNDQIVALGLHLYELLIESEADISVKDNNVAKSFIEWFMSHSLTPMSIVTNMAGKNPIFVFKRSLIRNTILLEDPTLMMTKPTNRYLGEYELTFAFTFYLQELTHFKLRYPFMVYQLPISSEWVPSYYKEMRHEAGLNSALETGSALLIRDGGERDWIKVIKYPNYDNWYPLNMSSDFIYKSSTAVSLSDVDEQVMLNLKDLPNIQWSKGIYEFIIKKRDMVTRPYDNVIHIRAFSDDISVLPEQLRLEENGDLILTRKPKMSNIYRVCIFLLNDLSLLSEAARVDLIEDKDYQKNILPTIAPGWVIGDKEIDNNHDLDGFLIDKGYLYNFPYGAKYMMFLDLFVEKGQEK